MGRAKNPRLLREQQEERARKIAATEGMRPAKITREGCQIEGCTGRAVAYIAGAEWRVCSYHSALYAIRKRQEKHYKQEKA